MKAIYRSFLTLICILITGLKLHAVSPAPDGGYPGGNTAEGQNTLLSLNSGGYNTAVGFFSLASNTTSDLNTAIGAGALLLNNANWNTAVGSLALMANQTGTGNVAVGYRARQNVVTVDGVICIGSGGDDISFSTWISAIYGVTTNNSNANLPVIVSPQGQLGTQSSSARFKKGIKPMDKTSEAILALKPVTFSYKSDNTNTPQFGLIAEDVAQVNPDLVVRDKKGDIYTVRYDAVNAMLLNEFLKEHAKVEQLKKGFESKVAAQQKQIEALTAGLQRVSAQLELNKAAPLTVENTN